LKYIIDLPHCDALRTTKRIDVDVNIKLFISF